MQSKASNADYSWFGQNNERRAFVERWMGCSQRDKSWVNNQTMGRTEIKAALKASGAGTSGPVSIMWKLSAVRTRWCCLKENWKLALMDWEIEEGARQRFLGGHPRVRDDSGLAASVICTVQVWERGCDFIAINPGVPHRLCTLWLTSVSTGWFENAPLARNKRL